MGKVIKVNSRPLQLCNRTLHAEQGRRSSAIRKKQHRFTRTRVLFVKLTCSILICKNNRKCTYGSNEHEDKHLTLLDYRSFGHRGRVAHFDVAGEGGLAVGQVLIQQATDVAWENAGFGTFLEGGVLLLRWVSGVEEAFTVRVLAKDF